MLQLTAFVVLSAVLAWVSRGFLRARRSHAFYRFFAWEAILALLVLNVENWFRDPLAPHQMASWILLCTSAFLVLYGVSWLRARGRPDRRRESDVPLIAFEKTTHLVVTGPYRFIRHPIYSSLLFLAWGVFFKDPSWPSGILVLAASEFLTATAKVEEGENLRYFGAAYEEYRKRTRMFIPFLF